MSPAVFGNLSYYSRNFSFVKRFFTVFYDFLNYFFVTTGIFHTKGCSVHCSMNEIHQSAIDTDFIPEGDFIIKDNLFHPTGGSR